ncbi:MULTISPECIES: acyl-CoA ligase FadD12 [Mycobacterium]|uniref:Long-chain-fatty-acid--CoA ligase FadD13 n=1 Tax=Mycobacterium indicus pranii (strain DSM 45239 / MTCC 9506) TaxID=1232724 RepID=J9WDZ2_MYCIP|nr:MULTISPECIES: acyl-CoA ligase FadD12 [Mycobacterium]AFS15245.1 Long-chain-fatty-acid--CoA ligase [Mycobacterium intracellulare subsp. intracellulare MTCC 9506]MCA2276198.1 bile acid CoA ligase [Mycobacterium intracellulare]MCA2326291.1 bile acid CoA ligase [Mycobacterium intracellulare]OCB20230.1 acyl-CoA synthetase [Mycobacterium intracellulare subsp. yongonense]UEB26711.1 acyl-CoA ligase FadD12 [Mycobacterium intracellulare]
MPNPLRETLGLIGTMRRAGLIAPMRPDRYVRIAAAMRREGMGMTSGFASAAQRCPDRPGLIDERGSLTWRELDERCNALAAALQGLPSGQPRVIGIMCRNHRGFVEALVAADRIGSDILLLNTSFAGPALADVVTREGVDAVIYDEEFTETVDRALAGTPDATRIVAWTDAEHERTVEGLIAARAGAQPQRTGRKGKMILLTSGTTGTPKGAKQSGGNAGIGTLKAILDRTPWRAEEPIVIVAPMFHAWGFSQLLLAASFACPVITRRKFDPEATLDLIDRHKATGLVVVPVMFDRIMDLPAEVRRRYSGRSLRFAAASGSRMRPDVVTAFMDEFGDVIYNNYNATEAGMIATATPADLRAAPDTAGRPAGGTEIRILDPEFNELPAGEVGSIYVRNNTQFDGYTSGSTKDFHAGFMSSGDVGYLDSAGRLFVVGRDDEMIVSGGENVYPIEVEKALAAHPDVAEAAVIGVDDEQYGQRLAAFVVLEPGAGATPDALKQHVRDNLANYKVPREIAVLDELPRSSTGKILRAELRARVGG